MADWIGLAESAYRLDGGIDDWVAGIRDVAGGLLDQGLGVAVHTFRAVSTALRTESVAVHGGPPEMEQIVRATNATASPEAVARTLGWGTTVSTMSEVIFEALPEARRQFLESAQNTAADVLGVLVLCGEGRGVSISIPIRETRRATPTERLRLGRIGAHLAAGMRLRRNLERAARLEHDGREAEAVLLPNGTLCDATGDAAAPEPRARLREAVLRFEHARKRELRADPESLSLWEGLVRGRWSLVDRFDSDGQRFIVARCNEPELGDPRGLSKREHQVSEYIGGGHSNKEIAYEFGISQSAVANAVARAQRKLGLHSRTELAQFFAPGGLRARLVAFDYAGEPFVAGATNLLEAHKLDALSDAERDVVLHLLRGATNAEIGLQRGTSHHTVANQIQSIYARLGVRSRVELAARLGET